MTDKRTIKKQRQEREYKNAYRDSEMIYLMQFEAEARSQAQTHSKILSLKILLPTQE